MIILETNLIRKLMSTPSQQTSLLFWKVMVKLKGNLCLKRLLHLNQKKYHEIPKASLPVVRATIHQARVLCLRKATWITQHQPQFRTSTSRTSTISTSTTISSKLSPSHQVRKRCCKTWLCRDPNSNSRITQTAQVTRMKRSLRILRHLLEEARDSILRRIQGGLRILRLSRESCLRRQHGWEEQVTIND